MFARKYNRQCLLYSLLSVASILSFSATAATIDNIRLWPAPDHTRLVLDMSGPVEHSFFTLDGPRLVVDIKNATFRTDLAGLNYVDTPIKNIRTGTDQHRLRIVFDLREEVDTNVFALEKMEDKQDRLVVDLVYRNPSAQEPVTLVDPTANGRRDIIIAIVAGHGGEDPGAIGPGNLYEKEVTLKICQNLERIINATPGYHAVMIRKGDYGIAHRQRREMARQSRADLFLAIHADAFKHRSANGGSVYALNMNGRLASSETARYLAERENEADLIGGLSNVSIRDKDEDVASTLMSLSRTATLNDSLRAGQYILDAMAGIVRLHKNQVEQADFAVLRSPDVPSLLIETGFISNPAEARRLSTPAFRNKMAESIFAGVKNYFYDFTPSGTYLAWQKDNGGLREAEHVVARGDTLSGIAIRYSVSVSDIMVFNQMTNTNIRLGQKIKIPST